MGVNWNAVRTGGAGRFGRVELIGRVMLLIVLFLPLVILCVTYLCSMATNGAGDLMLFSALPHSPRVRVSFRLQEVALF